MQLTTPFQSILPTIAIAVSVAGDVAAHPLTETHALLTPTSSVGQSGAFATLAAFPQVPDDGPDFDPDDDGSDDGPFRARRSLGLRDFEPEDVAIGTPVRKARAVATESADFPDFVPDDGANFVGADDDVPGLESTDPDPAPSKARRSMPMKRLPHIVLNDEPDDDDTPSDVPAEASSRARRYVHFGREVESGDGHNCDDQSPKARRSAVRRRPSTPMPKRFPDFDFADGPDEDPEDDNIHL